MKATFSKKTSSKIKKINVFTLFSSRKLVVRSQDTAYGCGVDTWDTVSSWSTSIRPIEHQRSHKLTRPTRWSTFPERDLKLQTFFLTCTCQNIRKTIQRGDCNAKFTINLIHSPQLAITVGSATSPPPAVSPMMKSEVTPTPIPFWFSNPPVCWKFLRSRNRVPVRPTTLAGAEMDIRRGCWKTIFDLCDL